MADVIALLQSDGTYLPCQLHRLTKAVDLSAAAGDALGVGYYSSGKALIRKAPVSKAPLSLDELGRDIRSDVFLASWSRTGEGGFREEQTPPFRYRNWVFAGKGKLSPGDGMADVIAALPDFLQRASRNPSEAEVGFLAALAHIHSKGHQLEGVNMDADVVAKALGDTLTELDRRADGLGRPRPETTALLSNGRMLVAVRRGRPLFYGLLEGVAECEVCGFDATATDRYPRVKAHKMLKSVAVTTRPRKDGIQWIEVPDGHLLAVNRSLAAHITPLATP